MNTTPSLPEFGQFLSQISTQLTQTLHQNYLHPYKTSLDILVTQTKKLNSMLLLVPQNNTHLIELHISNNALTLAPHQITTLQTITQSYLEKLESLARQYELLEEYALHNIFISPYRGFFTHDDILQPSEYILFMIQTTNTTYASLELQKRDKNEWFPARHEPKTLEQTIAQVSSSATILLVENPQQLPLLQTVEPIMLKKYFDKEM